MDKGPEPWRARQRRVLTELRGDRPQSVTALEAGLTLWRYIRMEEGETGLPAEFLRPLAAAYGVPLSELLAKLGIVDAQNIDWRAELIAAGYTDAEADALLDQATDADADARNGWLAFQVHKKRTRGQRADATPPSRHRVSSNAG